MGQEIDPRFKIINQIGKGGMGVVYHAEDISTKTEIAIKQLLKGTGSTNRPELFRREFEIISKFNHPNVLKAFEYFENEKADYYTMEFLPGISLKDWIKSRNGAQPAKSSLKILLQFAKALKHIHEFGIIHHDVHPHNLILLNAEAEPEVKLIDFGISLLKEQQKAEEIRIGAANYKSPEHYRGDILDYTADIYCFGAIAYELFTGQQPFDLKSYGLETIALPDYAQQRLHAFKKVPEVRNLPKKITYKVNRMVQICMEKEAEHRYQSMQELIERIEDLLAELN